MQPRCPGRGSPAGKGEDGHRGNDEDPPVDLGTRILDELGRALARFRAGDRGTVFRGNRVPAPLADPVAAAFHHAFGLFLPRIEGFPSADSAKDPRDPTTSRQLLFNSKIRIGETDVAGCGWFPTAGSAMGVPEAFSGKPCPHFELNGQSSVQLRGGIGQPRRDRLAYSWNHGQFTERGLDA